MLAFSLVIVGAVNWGLVGLMEYNLVTALLGGMPALEKLVYVLVGVSAVYLVFTHKNDCRVCGPK